MKVEDGEIVEDASSPAAAKEVANKPADVEQGAGNSAPTLSERKPSNWSMRDASYQKPSRMVKCLNPFSMMHCLFS